MPANVQTMFYYGKRPWHGKGTELDHPATAREAMEAAQMDWEVELQPIQTEAGLPIPGRFASVRKDNKAVLGIVGARYRPHQNRDCFGLFDTIVGTGQAIYHTAGVLGIGEKIWLLAKLPNNLVVRVGAHEDVTEKFLLLASSHDGSLPIVMFYTPVRVVCQNTLRAALGGSALDDQVRIKHTEKLEERVAEAQAMLGLAVGYYDNLEDQIHHWATIQMTTAMIKQYMETIVPVPQKSATMTPYALDRKAKIATERRTAIAARLESPTQDGIRGTLWGAYNSAVEWVDYGRALQEKTDRLENIWIGSGAVEKNRIHQVTAAYAANVG